ncbi:hypothetical protein [Roseimicrobium sp. ORNL1]|uniref:hypothetical protein n=1 Tax=Roseimicrobium sp. ORNL1 TaxID=2711231 RepID=UPI0013E10DF7|nr:hypothetical protein [Roseimicrobium sp. ORNL1]QIF03635.1 hypothetical protein G5S37_19610 [Roseimicrobium sp. ORNL1]
MLVSIGPAHVEADRYEEEGVSVKFFRGDSVIAEYPKVLVQEVALTTLSASPGGLLFSAE